VTDEKEPVGSLAEEAAKLLAALQGWSQETGADHAGAVADMVNGAARVLRDVNEHIATGGVDCRYCPVCRVIAVLRETSPEVTTHLGAAAASLMHAVAELMATRVPSEPKNARPEPSVEKIDLDDDDDAVEWEDD
jgi:hypothetical protein